MIECVGKFFGINTDADLYERLHHWWGDWSPARGECTAPP